MFPKRCPDVSVMLSGCFRNQCPNVSEICINDDKDISSRFYDNLSNVFSKENMKKLASDLKDISGAEFVKFLRTKLNTLMISYDLDSELMESCVSDFIGAILDEIKRNNKDEYTIIVLEEMRKEEENNLHYYKSQLEAIKIVLNKLGEKRNRVFDIVDMDKQLCRETESPKINLDFFRIDDNEFITAFHERIEQEKIFVVGKSKEETIYCILNEIRNLKQDRITLVVKDEDDWEKYNKEDIKNTILIPWFYSDNIPCIPGNTNIFVFGEDEPCYSSDSIKLRRRTRKTITNCLIDAGLGHQEADDLVDKTHGLYVPLKKKIFNGAYLKTPVWNKNNKAIITALLCGKWRRVNSNIGADGDTKVIEELSGMTYASFLDEVINYTKGENPLVIEIDKYSNSVYQLTSVEYAWETLDRYISNIIWDKFINCLYEVIDELLEIKNHTLEYSSALLHGMLRTLIMKAYYRKNISNQYIVDNIVRNILSKVTSVEKWGCIAQYFTDLCEAAPSVVLKKLEDEILKPTGMREYLDDNIKEHIAYRHHYTDIIWAIEQLLLQKDFVNRAIELLWDLNSLNIKYSISNSPRSTLETVFCAWYNVSVILTERKIESLKSAVMKYDNAWDIAYSLLPRGNSTICSTISHPIYREYDEPVELLLKDVHETYVQYLHACLANMKNSSERWNKIIEVLPKCDNEIFDEIIDKLIQSIQLMDDRGIIEIKDKLRSVIYNHRLFCKSNWVMHESKIKKLEEVLFSLHTNDSVFEYLFLFGSSFNFPLLHPVPYEEVNYSDVRRKNEKMMEMEIEEGIRKYENSNLPLEKLFSLCSEKESSTVGFYIAKYYGNREFNIEIVNKMLELDIKDNIVADYVIHFGKKNREYLSQTKEIVKQYCDKKELLVMLVTSEAVNSNIKEALKDESQDIRELFWQKGARLIDEEESSCKWAISDCLKNGTIPSYVQLLWDVKESLGLDYLYRAFVEIDKIKRINRDSMSSYLLSEILKILYSRYKDSIERCKKIAEIELFFNKTLTWSEMKFTQLIVKNSPDIYAQIVNRLFFHGDENTENKQKMSQEEINDLYDLYDKMLFYPSEKDGKVDYLELNKWVTNFREQLEMQKQVNLLGHFLGRLFACSPIGDDSYIPCEAIRKVIEEMNNQSLDEEYMIAEINKRGVYSPNAGKEEMEMAYYYKNNANNIRENYPKTAAIFDAISNNYKIQAIQERESAENEY